MEQSWRQHFKRTELRTKANVAVAIGTVATALLGGAVIYAEQAEASSQDTAAQTQPLNEKDDIHFPIIRNDPTITPTFTPTAPSAPNGCPDMRAWDIPKDVNGPFISPTTEAGTIFIFDINGNRFKFHHTPGSDRVGRIYSNGNWYDALLTDCTAQQVKVEYDNNPLPPIASDQMCEQGITCPLPTPTPTLTPSPTPTPTPEVCPPDQVQSQTLPRDPNAYHIVEPRKSGVMGTLWTDRDVDPPWGTEEVKAWFSPQQPTTYIFDAGGTIFYSDTCTWQQMLRRFQAEEKQEVTREQLCEAKITCQ